MTRPTVPGLSDAWAEHQLTLDALTPACTSCTRLAGSDGSHGWRCDPERPGCPLEEQ